MNEISEIESFKQALLDGLPPCRCSIEVCDVCNARMITNVIFWGITK